MSKWISEPKFSSVEFYSLKNKFFVLISSVQIKKSNFHHNNLKSILYSSQDKDQNIFYFIPEVVKNFDGVRLVENLYINDIELTFVSLIDCIDVYFLKQNKCTT